MTSTDEDLLAEFNRRLSAVDGEVPRVGRLAVRSSGRTMKGTRGGVGLLTFGIVAALFVAMQAGTGSESGSSPIPGRLSVATKPSASEPVLAPSSSTTPTATTSEEPELICGRLTEKACAQVVEAVLQYAAGAIDPSDTIVADYSCGPGEGCEATFTAIVVAIPATGSLDGGSALVFGVRGYAPSFSIWNEDIKAVPAHIRALVPTDLASSAPASQRQ